MGKDWISTLSVTEEELYRWDSQGYCEGMCTECGCIHEQLEPDAEDYKCESCGENAVTAIPRLLGYI